MTWREVDTSGWRPKQLSVPHVYATDCAPDHITEWMCAPPSKGVRFAVLRDTWDEVAVEWDTYLIVEYNTPNAAAVNLTSGKIRRRRIWDWETDSGDSPHGRFWERLQRPRRNV